MTTRKSTDHFPNNHCPSCHRNKTVTFDSHGETKPFFRCDFCNFVFSCGYDGGGYSHLIPKSK